MPSKPSIANYLMRWLHLSDLHIGRNSPAQERGIASLLEAVLTALDSTPLDAVILSGDLVHSGKKAEFDQAADVVIRPLRTFPECATAKLIVAPGNHDLNCGTAFPITWDSIGKTRQELFSKKRRKLVSFALRVPKL